ncbi:MAG: hypothetical protein JST16_08925 [Bdellovibrionales bacterium]|nr:hypothetical protein [Bdellovibrionales bacterium]
MPEIWNFRGRELDYFRDLNAQQFDEHAFACWNNGCTSPDVVFGLPGIARAWRDLVNKTDYDFGVVDQGALYNLFLDRKMRRLLTGEKIGAVYDLLAGNGKKLSLLLSLLLAHESWPALAVVDPSSSSMTAAFSTLAKRPDWDILRNIACMHTTISGFDRSRYHLKGDFSDKTETTLTTLLGGAFVEYDLDDILAMLARNLQKKDLVLVSADFGWTEDRYRCDPEEVLRLYQHPDCKAFWRHVARQFGGHGDIVCRIVDRTPKTFSVTVSHEHKGKVVELHRSRRGDELETLKRLEEIGLVLITSAYSPTRPTYRYWLLRKAF